VVGITGSVGKTSTKDLLAAALASTLRTAASPRSFNNEQGLPVTILDSADDTDVMVLEMSCGLFLLRDDFGRGEQSH
jgi:UDP-N-acetylmuramoyl-tripeptide--D-alanyl-D-alanine ligase